MKRWAKNFDQCVLCNSTKYKHTKQGMCSSCYQKEYRRNPQNLERIKESKRRWQNKQPKEYFKLKREDREFDGKRDFILIRDKYECQICGNKINLVIHHIDKKGRNKETKNNDNWNLITLCKSCHIYVHRKDLQNQRHSNWKNKWSRKFDFCQKCKTKEIPHASRGLCLNCYPKQLKYENNGYKKRFLWSLKYSKCQKCGTTKHKHIGKGFCIKCYRSPSSLTN